MCGSRHEPCGLISRTLRPRGPETLTGTAEGFGGDVTVTLTVEDGAITACTITGDDETPDIGGAALEEL